MKSKYIRDNYISPTTYSFTQATVTDDGSLLLLKAWQYGKHDEGSKLIVLSPEEVKTLKEVLA